MKTIYNKIFNANLWKIMLFSMIVIACRPEGDNLTLSALPQPTFQAVEISPGRVQLTYTTNTPTTASWTSVSSVQKLTGYFVVVALIFAGNYDVKMAVLGHGGMASMTQPVTVKLDESKAFDDK